MHVHDFKLVTRVETEKPWVTKSFRYAILEQQKAYLNDKSLYRVLRNKVNHMRKSLRKHYIKSHVESLDKHQSRNLWKEVKSLTGDQHSYNDLLYNNVYKGTSHLLPKRSTLF